MPSGGFTAVIQILIFIFSVLQFIYLFTLSRVYILQLCKLWGWRKRKFVWNKKYRDVILLSVLLKMRMVWRRQLRMVWRRQLRIQSTLQRLVLELITIIDVTPSVIVTQYTSALQIKASSTRMPVRLTRNFMISLTQ